MELVITTDGEARMVYQEELDLSPLGLHHIQRASHVEPDAQGDWWADLSPVDGPLLGPFKQRRLALTAETAWLAHSLLKNPASRPLLRTAS